jgi:hypothetical protein
MDELDWTREIHLSREEAPGDFMEKGLTERWGTLGVDHEARARERYVDVGLEDPWERNLDDELVAAVEDVDEDRTLRVNHVRLLPLGILGLLGL